jgi:beta-mannosidase
VRRLGLEGSWKLVRVLDGSSRPMTLPGDIMSALLAAGEIADPYLGKNELELQWIGREDWRLEREFEADADLLSYGSVILEALVIDTVAELWLNGSLLGTSRNMFRRFRAEARPLLKAGSNRLEIRLASPEKAAAEEAAALPYPIPASEYPVFSPHRNLLRKAQCMAGWDWGPCLMTGGVYDGIGLLCQDGPSIDYATTRMSRRGEGSWKVEVRVEIDAPLAQAIGIEVELAGSRLVRDLELPAGRSSQLLELEPAGVEVWQPAGYGKQPLYDLVVRLRPRDGAPDRGAETRKRVGFRVLEVVSEEDGWGRSFKLRVNGREVFAKGANWIPADALPSNWTRERLADLLDSTVAANMNCLRVWGGGRYESEAFYELCDERGILVWQDCMFSCALYPSSPAFLAEVEAELRHQVRRLKDHPSIALWCGNNEALGAITWYEESRANPARYIVDYDRLTEGTVGRVVRELDPDRCWWPSSPSAGPDDYSDNWHRDGRGDMHFWSVWHEGKPFSAYLGVKPRFCSEFGYQSYPSERMVARFAPEGERNVSSPVFEHHQRHPRGNTIIIENMLRYFRLPAGFRATLYLSQVQQALAIRTAVEYWRSLRPLCMGALYWQLNDVWPVSSWSSLDHDGSWKLLHHEARRFFEPLHLALVLREGAIEAHVENDLAAALDFRLDLAFRRFDGSLVAAEAAAGRVGGDSAQLAWRTALAGLPAGPEELFLEARLQAGGEQRRATAFLTEPKRCSLVDPRLEAVAVETEEGLAVRLRAAAPAFWVAVDLNPLSGIAGRFEDSGFDLAAGEERLLRFIPAGDGASAEGRRPGLAAFASALRTMDLRASYAEPGMEG